MPAAPIQASARPSAQYLALYRATVQQAAGEGGTLMSKMIEAARPALQTSKAAARDLRERDALAESAKQLRNRESDLCTAYPKALLAAFSNPQIISTATSLSNLDVHFDQLELMDEGEMMASVLVARTLQVATLAAEASLAELNTLICGTLGMATVRPESNPLRTQVYVNALKTVIEKTPVSATTRLDWLGAMGVALEQE